MTDQPVPAEPQPHPADVVLLLSVVDGNLIFEGHVNQDKPGGPEPTCLYMADWLGKQWPILCQMAMAAHPSRQQPAQDSEVPLISLQ